MGKATTIAEHPADDRTQPASLVAWNIPIDDNETL